MMVSGAKSFLMVSCQPRMLELPTQTIAPCGGVLLPVRNFEALYFFLKTLRTTVFFVAVQFRILPEAGQVHEAN